MRHIVMIAMLAAGAAVSANAQEGSWGDGAAALYNVPMGYGSQAEFQGKPKEPKRDGKPKRKPTAKRYAATCAFGLDGLTPDDGARARADEGPEFPLRPCFGTGGPTPMQTKQLDVKNNSAVTTGSWNLSVVERQGQTRTGEPAPLNGGLNLD